MLRSRIDLNLLNIFEAVYSAESVTGAAKRLNLSQSAVSHSLSRLRRELDDALFVRMGNRLVPTALARALAEPIRDALRGVNIAVANAVRFEPATSDRLFRIGLRPTVESLFFDDLVHRMRCDAPQVRIASVDFRRARLLQSLADSDLDLAIDIPTEATSALQALPLLSDRLVVAVRPGHPAVSGAIDLVTYLAADHVTVSPRPAAPGAEDDALAAFGARRRVIVQCQHALTAWEIVAQSDALLTLRESSALALRSIRNLQLLPLPFDVPERRMQLLWHEAADRDPGNMWLRGIVRAVFGGDMHGIDTGHPDSPLA